MEQAPFLEEARSYRAAGGMLVVLSLLIGVMMVLHPTSGTDDPASFVERMGRGVPGNAMVHGMLVGLMLLTVPGFLAFADSLGSGRLTVRLGTVSLAFGTATGVVAGLVNGFVVPAHAGRVGPGELDGALQVIGLCHVVNQLGARCSVIGLGMSAAAWSVVLLNAPRGRRRAAGAAGLVLGIAPSVLMMAGELRMDVQGFGAFVAAHCVWTALAGGLLLGRRAAE